MSRAKSLITMTAARRKPIIGNRQLELFAIRCSEIADRVQRGEIGFIDAVDMAYSAAQWAGLTETVGDDAVQAIMAAAFANAMPSA